MEDYKVLLDMDDIDTLIICTPGFHHIHVLRDAIVSSKTFYAENLCTTIQDCLEVRALVQSTLLRKASGSFGLEWVSVGQ